MQSSTAGLLLISFVPRAAGFSALPHKMLFACFYFPGDLLNALWTTPTLSPS